MISFEARLFIAIFFEAKEIPIQQGLQLRRCKEFHFFNKKFYDSVTISLIHSFNEINN